MGMTTNPIGRYNEADILKLLDSLHQGSPTYDRDITKKLKAILADPDHGLSATTVERVQAAIDAYRGPPFSF